MEKKQYQKKKEADGYVVVEAAVLLPPVSYTHLRGAPDISGNGKRNDADRSAGTFWKTHPSAAI